MTKMVTRQNLISSPELFSFFCKTHKEYVAILVFVPSDEQVEIIDKCGH